MAWTETLGSKAELLVARRKGTAWERLPLPRAEGERKDSVTDPLMAIDNKARLVLAWIENPGGGPRRIFVKRNAADVLRPAAASGRAIRRPRRLLFRLLPAPLIERPCIPERPKQGKRPTIN